MMRELLYYLTRNISDTKEMYVYRSALQFARLFYLSAMVIIIISTNQYYSDRDRGVKSKLLNLLFIILIVNCLILIRKLRENI